MANVNEKKKEGKKVDEKRNRKGERRELLAMQSSFSIGGLSTRSTGDEISREMPC